MHASARAVSCDHNTFGWTSVREFLAAPLFTRNLGRSVLKLTASIRSHPFSTNMQRPQALLLLQVVTSSRKTLAQEAGEAPAPAPMAKSTRSATTAMAVARWRASAAGQGTVIRTTGSGHATK